MSNKNPITVRVISEHYRVAGPRGACFDSIGQAIKAAFAEAVRGNYYSITVERVTVHEPYDDGLFGAVTETVTGVKTITGPAAYVQAPELSRYHPNNGWSVPATITVEA